MPVGLHLSSSIQLPVGLVQTLILWLHWCSYTICTMHMHVAQGLSVFDPGVKVTET
jgi:hypothetical protein